MSEISSSSQRDKGDDKWSGRNSLTQSNLQNSLDNLLNTQNDPAEADIYIAKHDYSTDQPGQLSIHKGEKLRILRKSENGDRCEATNDHGEIGWIPTSYIAKVNSLEKHSWFHGNITREEAEVSLSSGINGSFLVRESMSEPGQYSISLHYDGHVFHYLVLTEPQTSHYFVNPAFKFENLPELVSHYSKNNVLATLLHYPAPNPRKPPIHSLSHEVDEWEVKRSDINMGQLLGGGLYGEVYKAVIKKRGISVAVKTFRVSQSTLNLNRDIVVSVPLSLLG